MLVSVGTGCQNSKLALEMGVHIAEEGAAASAPTMLLHVLVKLGTFGRCD
jgi:hypothetical protein